MSLSEQLANLVRTGQLKPHQPAPGEIRSHLDNARDGLRDAARADNSLGSRFRLANDAGHDLLTAKLKMLGYRTGSERGHRDIL
ncbi:MAG: hypothetical protein Q8J72_04105, partial [Rhodocyclaceae bacterium]|nr:hypothetical protein [Rhodocyclaceae bacterium]